MRGNKKHSPKPIQRSCILKNIFAFQNISIRGVNLVQDPKPGSESSQVKGENQVIKLDPGIVIEDNVVTLENHKLVSTLTRKSIFLKMTNNKNETNL